MVIEKISYIATHCCCKQNFKRKTTENREKRIKCTVECEFASYLYIRHDFQPYRYLSPTRTIVVSIISRMFKQFFYSVTFLLSFSTWMRKYNEKIQRKKTSTFLFIFFFVFIPGRFARVKSLPFPTIYIIIEMDISHENSMECIKDAIFTYKKLKYPTLSKENVSKNTMKNGMKSLKWEFIGPRVVAGFIEEEDFESTHDTIKTFPFSNFLLDSNWSLSLKHTADTIVVFIRAYADK